MRIYFILTGILFVFSLTIPFITCTASKNEQLNNSLTTEAEQAEITTNEKTEEKVTVFKTSTGEALETDINEYIIGVVAGEMPASFSPEALKAQAVAAYTYLKYINEAKSSSPLYTITDSAALHQSYVNKEEQKKKWGEDYNYYRSIIENAVKSTKGEYLAYDGKTAMTVFHAASKIRTNTAKDVWGSAVPYLTSVEAPCKEAFKAETSFTPDEFKARFEEKGKVEFDDTDIKKWALITQKSEAGYIQKLKVCKKEFSACEIREILSLPSTNFTGEIKNNTFIFTSEGKGHGVGMSQYSAEYMAEQGKSYKEILMHFYPGTTLEKE